MGYSEVMQFAKDNGVKLVDFRFVDLPGVWQHKTVPLSELSEGTFQNGTGFDGSSIRGFQTIDESDMLLIPDASTAMVDPFMLDKTMSIVCDVLIPGAKKYRYSKDPRHIAFKAEEYLKTTGIADASYWGPELEFFIFDSVRYHHSQNGTAYEVDSEEGIWNSFDVEDGGRNLGHKVRNKEGYFPVPPVDALQDIRSEMILTLISLGVNIETHHHEVATAGQGEIDMRFDTLTKMADNTLLQKYVVKNVAKKHNKTATFMPKPLFGDNGSGMHVHQSLWKEGKPIFYDEKGYAELSETALYYIGGLLEHASALMAFCAPSTNSYKRLVPGYEAPVNIGFSQRNRSAAIRIPMYGHGPAAAKSKRIEFRPPDPSCNPYLAFSAMLMAGLDGIQRKVDPVKKGYGPFDTNIYKLSNEEKKKIKSVPGSLNDSLDALLADHEFLLKGGVFTKDIIEHWTELKRGDVDDVRMRPHPYEFHLYYDI